MKVYVVTGILLDDYHLYGVFSSKEKADIFVEQHENTRHEELEMDQENLRWCAL